MAVEDVGCGVEARLLVLGPVPNVVATVGVRPRDLTFFAGASGEGEEGSVASASSAAGMGIARRLGNVAAAAGGSSGCVDAGEATF